MGLQLRGPELDRFDDHMAFRQSLVDRFKRELFGPCRSDPEQDRTELLEIPPLQLYAAGVLFPQRTVQEVLEGQNDTEETDVVEETSGAGDLNEAKYVGQSRRRGHANDGGSTTEAAEPLNLANEFSPSAMGLSLRLAAPQPLIASVSFGTYTTAKTEEPHPRAGQIAMDGTPFPNKRTINGYRRTHHSYELPLDILQQAGRSEPLAIGDPALNLRLHMTTRRRNDGSCIVSVMAVNHHVGSEGISSDTRDAFFQVSLVIKDPDDRAIFLPIDREFGNANDEEMASMELLYRHRRAFALGHGAAGDWNRDELQSSMGVSDMVCTATIPEYDLKPIRAREEAFDKTPLDLSMRYLFEGSGSTDPEDKIIGALNALTKDYEGWIRDVESKIPELPERMRGAAEKHIRDCRICLSRMTEGVEYLRDDTDAMLAFRLMNKAMLIQQFHSSVLGFRELGDDFPDIPKDYRNLPGGERKWRPFQLAFILINVACMADPERPERSLVDLIWFPTGGGKTEAYLGLAAYTICIERLQGRNDGGTVVLMRYTLRLLTAQQFQRAASLILALERIRVLRELGVDLGEAEIAIGLWVGMSLSPNKRAAATRALTTLQQERSASNPFQVLQCPWCGVNFTNRDNLGYVSRHSHSGGPRTVKFRCPDDRCDYGHADATLPIYVIDEVI